MKYLSILTLLLVSYTIKAQKATLLREDLVDLKGKAGKTVFINLAPDTLKLGYVFFNWLPYTETRDTITIPPGQKDSIVLTYNFPDFILINGRVKIYNTPGSTLICTIRNYRSKNVDMSFSGDFAQENTYYLAYQQFLGHYNKESSSYYDIGESLDDWNQFPVKADSITKKRLLFLNQYEGSLPEWFKKHEHRRLLYNHYLRLYNVLRSKEFYGGHKINVNPKYYDFEKLLNQEDDMVLSDIYFYCMEEYWGRKASMAKKQFYEGAFFAIDSLYHQTNIGDVNLMFVLGKFYKNNKPSYDSLMKTLKFKQPERKEWVNSAVQIMLGMPSLGKKAPTIALTDIKSKTVNLTDYADKMIILNFWAVWCGPCKAEFPYENKLYQQYKDKGLVIINICYDSDRENWVKDSKKYNLQMVNLYTNKADYNKLIRQYNLTSPPRSILINRQGNVVDNYLKRASLLTNNDIIKILAHK